MAEPLTIVGTVLSGVATLIGIATALYVRAQGTTPAPQSGATILPGAPQSSLTGLDGPALAGRVAALEQRAADQDRREVQIQAKREEMAEGLIRIETMLDERTRRGGGSSGSTRESR